MNEQSLKLRRISSILANEDDPQNSALQLTSLKGRQNSFAKQTSIITKRHSELSWNERGRFSVVTNGKLPPADVSVTALEHFRPVVSAEDRFGTCVLSW